MPYYVEFTAKQGNNHRYGLLGIGIKPTDEIVHYAILHTTDLDIESGPILVEWVELSEQEYNRLRGERIRELGPADITNMADEKTKMN